MKLHKNDIILVTAGKDSGKQAVISKVFPKKGKVLLEGVNQYKKHVKPAQGRVGEIVTLSRPLDVSKVALVCPKCKQPTRVGYRFQDDKKIRVCRKCDSDIVASDKVTSKKTTKKKV
jgi:large subunit ribosomal protein L24